MGRGKKQKQKNNLQIKEQHNFSEDELIETYISSLSDIEFRVVVIRMLSSMKKYRNYGKQAVGKEE